MTAGVHGARFEMRDLGIGAMLGGAMLGVAGPGFDPAAGGAAWTSAEGWLMDINRDGNLRHNGGDKAWDKDGEIMVKEGDVVVRLPRPRHSPLSMRRLRLTRSGRCRACCSTATRPP